MHQGFLRHIYGSAFRVILTSGIHLGYLHEEFRALADLTSSSELQETFIGPIVRRPLLHLR